MLPKTIVTGYIKEVSKVVKIAWALSLASKDSVVSKIEDVASTSNIKDRVTVHDAALTFSAHPNVNAQNVLKYSVEELFGLRDQASVVKGELLSHREMMQNNGTLRQQGRSRAGSAAKLSHHIPQKTPQKSWAASSAAAHLSTPKTPQTSLKTQTTNNNTDSVSYGVLLPSIGQKPEVKPGQPSPGVSNRPRRSEWDMPRLTSSFEDLKIEASSQSPAILIPKATPALAQTASTQPISRPQPMAILGISNKKDDIAKSNHEAKSDQPPTKDFNFIVGQEVTRDQILFKIDPRPYQATYGQAIAQVNLAKCSWNWPRRITPGPWLSPKRRVQLANKTSTSILQRKPKRKPK